MAEPNPFSIHSSNATKAAWMAKHDRAKAWCQFTAARDRGELDPIFKAAEAGLFPPIEPDRYAWVDAEAEERRRLWQEQERHIEAERARTLANQTPPPGWRS